ncbi:4-hydroxythreonine-4-phosphate dehydrogenase PdxA [Sphingobacterium psychroaquaticum]|uniref:4-hydroxythreonine-4-phosphate dehydrogenase n=1 Tax=Sphingobacterium psychroaquaticum TaxID=561061 RepID=A0A1X7L695_9SPHI|nr:4-hydroxythreonine-4-phosphate dehydrogenase PdxA [Sphingobacterium psychroaquaticum]QBQ42321.1 4-hydroxythreonine-4-phosphate dehydrogenase PdxA [Sphingobacterium psychroaquaticum]SMG49255.1 4-hydroxythreonine-4-phosphate dehydrogenase [Sphingobacterium psychroaquaticum]
MSEKLKIGITVGDINGIGLEVIIKSLMDNRVLEYFTPIVYGNTKVASFHRKAIGVQDFSFNVINSPDQANPKRSNIINCWQEDVKITLGEQNEIGGKYAFLSLEKAVEDLNAGRIDALVTAPINKHNIQQDGFNFPGHTEYLQAKSNASDVLMFMITEELRVGVVTGHIPVKDIASSITEEAIMQKLKMMHESLKKDFWVQKPKIAVLGLNPHAGDNGIIGTEDDEIIRPAIEKANQEGVFCFGPYPADGFFATDSYTKFDAVLAMYHDQGLIPFKHIASRQGVNYTAGLPVVRTSPDHGTGYDIAGKNLASHESFLEAIFKAVHIVKCRREQAELTANPLAFRRLSKDRD